MARPGLAPIELARLATRHPFSTRITDEDARYIEDRCEDWSAEYRLCVIEQHGGGFRCGREDVVWATLPHVRDWLEELEGRAGMIGFFAEQRVIAAERAFEQAQTAQRFNVTSAYGWTLVPELDQADARRRAARQLATSCAVKPLEQPECVALLPQ